jgi:MerR family copper efflux transcriptional regulator
MPQIGWVVKQSGVAADTIRFYEKRGLLGKPPRTAGGFRDYNPQTVRVLQFIARAKQLGFTLREVKHLLRLQAGRHSTRADFRAFARGKLADIDAKIADLTRMRDALRPLVARCNGVGSLAGCPIVEALTNGSRPAGHVREE